MSMFFSGQDDDEDYAKDQEDRGLFGREDRSEWQARRDRAREISSGFCSVLFERDEAVWAEVRRLEAKND